MSTRRCLPDVLRAGGYVIHWRHASATVCSDRLDLGPAATTSSPDWWKSCDADCPSGGPVIATARQLSDIGRSESVAIGQALDQRGVPIGRMLASEFCRNVETAQLMDLGPPIEQSPAITYFVYDEGGRCADTFALLAEAPPAGTNTALIGKGERNAFFNGLGVGERTGLSATAAHRSPRAELARARSRRLVLRSARPRCPWGG